MNKPVLVVMAAGMGSRYGGLKQLDPVGNHGQLIIDYSIYDARRAGFETVVFVIKRELEDAFKAAIGDRLSKVIDVRYAYQELSDLPEDTRNRLAEGISQSSLDEAWDTLSDYRKQINDAREAQRANAEAIRESATAQAETQGEKAGDNADAEPAETPQPQTQEGGA